MKTSGFRPPWLGLVFGIAFGASTPALRAQPGSIDATFNASITTGHFGLSVVLQPDGKVIGAGSFGVVRLLDGGSVDPTFSQPFPPGQTIGAAVVQPDGRIVITGSVTNAAGTRLPGIVRLNANGSLDATFNLDADVTPAGRVLALQPDGKLLTSGSYLGPGNDERAGLLRLQADGTFDQSFDSRWLNTTADFYDLKLAADGRVYFATFYDLGRVNPDGSEDVSFRPDHSLGPWGAIALQSDGKVLAGQYENLLRLLPDGSADPGWHPPEFIGGDPRVYALLVQEDGKIIVGGNNLGGTYGIPMADVFRLNADGTTDSTFDSGAMLHYYSAEDLAFAPDGKVLVAGLQLTRPDISAAPGIWRLNNTTLSQPRLAISLAGGDLITLRLQGKPGASYRLECQEQIPAGGPWIHLADLTLSGSEASWEDAGWQSSPARFYRAVLVP